MTSRRAPSGLSLVERDLFYWVMLVAVLVALRLIATSLLCLFGAELARTRDQPRRMNASVTASG